MNSNSPKENENPTILSVEKDRSHARRTPLEWSQLGSFKQEYSSFNAPAADAKPDVYAGASSPESGSASASAYWMPITAEDRSVLLALSEISKATHGRGVSLLQHAGLNIPESPTMNPFPRFQAFEEGKQDHNETPISVAHTYSTRRLPEHDRFDVEEIFDIIRSIQDPEHPNTLEELGVVSIHQVQVNDNLYPSPPSSLLTSATAPSLKSTVAVRFTPTIPNCSMATLIGLCLRVKLMRSLPRRFKISVQIEPGTHASEMTINKQLRDKERVCAALENKHLAGVVNKCIKQGAAAHAK